MKLSSVKPSKKIQSVNVWVIRTKSDSGPIFVCLLIQSIRVSVFRNSQMPVINVSVQLCTEQSDPFSEWYSACSSVPLNVGNGSGYWDRQTGHLGEGAVMFCP